MALVLGSKPASDRDLFISVSEAVSNVGNGKTNECGQEIEAERGREDVQKPT